MAALRGVIVRCGIASLPLLAVVLLCLVMFSGLGKKPNGSGLNVQVAFIPAANAATVATTETRKKAVIQAAFERLHITHATIRVPN